MIKRLLLAILLPISLWAQVPVSLSPAPKLQFFTVAGVPLAGGKVCTYIAGTSTPLATYTDSIGGTSNTNPLILDSGGFAGLGGVGLWLGPAAYKIVLRTPGTDATCSTGSVLWTVDGVNSGTGALNATTGTFSGDVAVGDDLTVTGSVTGTLTVDNKVVTPNLNGIRYVYGSDLGAGIASAISDIVANSAGKGKIMVTSSGTVTTAITIPAPNSNVINIEGCGRLACKLTWNGAAGGIMFDASAVNNFSVSQMWLNGGNLAYTAVKAADGINQRYFHHYENLYVDAFTGLNWAACDPTGTGGPGLSDSIWYNVASSGGTKGMCFSRQNNLIVETDNLNMTQAGVELGGNSKVAFVGGHFSANLTDILISGDSSGGEFDKVWFENSTGTAGILCVGASCAAPSAKTLLAPLNFTSCNLHTTGGTNLLDTTGLTGNVIFIGNVGRSGGSSVNVVMASTLTEIQRIGNTSVTWSGTTPVSLWPGGFIHLVSGNGNDFVTACDSAGGATPCYSVRVNTTNLEVADNAKTAVLMRLSQAGLVFFKAGATLSTNSTTIANHLSGTASLDFAAWSGSDCQDLTMNPAGLGMAASGDTVTIGVPTALASVAGVEFTGFVSSAGIVTVRGCKIAAGASADPAAATVRADVWQH